MSGDDDNLLSDTELLECADCIEEGWIPDGEVGTPVTIAKTIRQLVADKNESAMADGCLDMIEEVLKDLGIIGDATPAMSFDDAIFCYVTKLRREKIFVTKALRRLVANKFILDFNSKECYSKCDELIDAEKFGVDGELKV